MALNLEAIQEVGHRLGYSHLKAKQIEAVSSFMKGLDVFVSLPTGYRKSIICALLPYVFDKVKGSQIIGLPRIWSYPHLPSLTRAMWKRESGQTPIPTLFC